MIKKSQNNGFSFSNFSEKAGFKSKSQLSGILNQKRSVTPVSLPKVVKGLGLKGDVKKLFLLLVEREEGGLNEVEKDRLFLKIKRLRQKIKLKYSSESIDSPEQGDAVFNSRIHLNTFCALGSLEKGASLEEIKLKIEQKEENILDALKRLISSGIAYKKGDRYYVKDASLVFDCLGNSNIFKRLYLEAINDIKIQATKNFSNKEALYYHSSFSLSRERLKDFRNKLRGLVDEFVNNEQDDEGCKVSSITIGFI